MKTIVVYGSTTGATEAIAKQIASKLDADYFDVNGLDFELLHNYELILFGTSTWGIGDIQDDWEVNIDKLSTIKLKNKNIALFGLGDQESYPDSYIDGVKTLFDAIDKSDISMIGTTETKGYSYDSSQAVVGDTFIGLAIDEDTQPNLTEKRVDDWVEQLKSEVK